MGIQNIGLKTLGIHKPKAGLGINWVAQTLVLTTPYTDIVKITASEDSEFKIKVNNSIFYSIAEIKSAINSMFLLNPDEDLISKIFRFLISNTNIHYDIAGSAGNNNLSPIIQFNAYNRGACYSMSLLAYNIFKLYYPNSQGWNTPGHNIAGPELEAYTDIGYRMMIFKGKYIQASMAEVQADRSLMAEPLKKMGDIGLETGAFWDTYVPGYVRVSPPGTYTEVTLTADNLTMKLCKDSYCEFPYKSANTFKTYSGVTIPYFANLKITSPTGKTGVNDMPFILNNVTGTGTVKINGITYTLPTNQAALKIVLELYAIWYHSYEILTNTGGIVAEYLVNPQTVKLLTNNTIKTQKKSGNFTIESASTANPLNTYDLTVDSGNNGWTDDCIRYFNASAVIKKVVGIAGIIPVFAASNHIYFKDQDADGKRAEPQFFQYNTPSGSKTITAGIDVIDQCFSSKLTEVDNTYSIDITLTSSDGSNCYYTLDGSVPDATKTLYTVPFTLSIYKTLGTVIKWINIKADYADSIINTRTVNVNPHFDIEKITNGDFSAWTGNIPNGWGVGGADGTHYLQNNGNKCEIVNPSYTNLRVYQNVLTSGHLYRILITVSGYTSGDPSFTDTVSVQRSLFPTNKIYLFDHIALANYFMVLFGTGNTGYTLDDISCKEILNA